MSTTEKIWFADDEPSTRFPLYCRGNVGEVLPTAPTPMTASMMVPAFQGVFSGLFGETGAFSAEEQAEPAGWGGVFGAYLYINLSFVRVGAVRMPGIGPKDIDLQMLGTSDAPPYHRHPDDRSIVRSASALRMVRVILGGSTTDLDSQRLDADRWIASLPEKATDEQLIARAVEYVPRLTRDLRSLIDVSIGSAFPYAILERLTGRAARKAPGVVVRMLSGLGTIETARPASDLWHLGRQVAASSVLTRLFDPGVPGLHDRLAAAHGTDAEVDAFIKRFEAFLLAHGHRGPNELEVASETWGTDPAIVLAAIERLRLSPSDADPEASNRRLAEERAEVTARVRRQLLPPLRPIFDRVLAKTIAGAPRREQAKGTLVIQLHGLRLGLFELADRLIAAGAIPNRTSLFMVTVDELAKLVADPASMAEEIAERRALWDDLNALVPPFFFQGRIPDPSTWARRGQRGSGEGAKPGDVLTGIGVGSGKATGPARVITDPADPGAMLPGDVLVAPITDPAWTPLFLTAVAVVVDVGAVQSHAAIVARELGIPAVVSVAGASVRIADGTEIEVDGDRGTVRILG